MPDPTAAPVPEPTAAPVVDGAITTGSIFDHTSLAAFASDEAVTCMADTLGADSVEYAAAFNSDALAALSSEAQIDVVARAYPCAPETITTSLLKVVGADDEDFPPLIGECIAAEIFDGDEVNELAVGGLLELSVDQPAPIDTQEPVIQVMLNCFTGENLDEGFAEALAADEDLAGVEDLLDKDCLVEAFDEENMRPVWTTLVQDPGVGVGDTLTTTTMTCLNFASIFVAQFEAQGIQVGEETIGCLEEAFAGLDITSPEGEAAMTGALFGCLNEEELAAMMGG